MRILTLLRDSKAYFLHEFAILPRILVFSLTSLAIWHYYLQSHMVANRPEARNPAYIRLMIVWIVANLLAVLCQLGGELAYYGLMIDNKHVSTELRYSISLVRLQDLVVQYLTQKRPAYLHNS